MASLTPIRLLPGVYIQELFPVTTSIANGPSFTTTLIGPVRTVIRGEQGILGGPALSTFPPCLSESVTRWGFIVAFSASATVDVNFAGTIISITTDDVDVFVAQLRTRLLAANVTLAAIRDIYTATTPVPGERLVKILASQSAIESGFFPSIQFTYGAGATITTELGAPVPTTTYLMVTVETATSHALPTLAPNWASILNRRVIEEVIYGLDASRRGQPLTEPERFYFDTTSRMNDKLNEYLGLSASQKAFFGDFTFLADATTIASATPVVISKVPLNGTQRATAISVRTGIEYELRLGFDYSIAPAPIAGAYQYGDSLSWIALGPTWSVFGTDPILIRASYIPDRHVMPLPVLNYDALVPRTTDVLVPARLEKFTFDPAGGGTVFVDHDDPPQAARITYSGVYNIVKTAGESSTLVNMAPRLRKTVSVSAISAVDIIISANGFCTPGIDPATIVITRSDGTQLVNPTDWTFSVATNAFTFYVAGPNQPTAVASNPLTINYNYLPQVTFVGNPTITSSIVPTTVGYTPAFVHLGGGLFSVNTPGTVETAIVITQGTGYTSTPVVAITGGGGTGATAVAVLDAMTGTITSVVITNHGTGYTSEVTVTITGGGGSGAAAIATIGPAGLGGVESVTVLTGGEYLTPPTVLFNGVTTNANAVAILSPAFVNFFVSAIVVTDPGTGYLVAPTITFSGGGEVTAATATSALAVGGITAVAALTATVEYPVQPELRLEFMADRGDLDGDLYFPSTTAELVATPQLQDVYAAQSIAVDTTVANPTLHATAITLALAPTVPAILGVGSFESSARIEPVLDSLKAQANAYWLVSITQDSDAVLNYVGAHIDTMVATIAGTQVHYAPGGFRVLLTTLDQRNEIQYVPLAKDTTFGTGFLVNAVAGGVAVQINLIGSTGDLTQVVPGDFVEFYQTDPTGSAIYGTTAFAKPVAKRLLITNVDTSTLTAAQFTVSDVSIPVTLDPSGAGDTTFAFKYGAPIRLLRVRQDLELGGDLGAFVEGIGNQPNGRRRWIRQPDMIVISDIDGVTRVVPGLYLNVIESAVRSVNLPHQGLTNFPLPVVTDVHRGANYYSSSDVINLMTDGGIQYAIKRSQGEPVKFAQQLTSDRDNQLTQSPTVTQIVDFAARLIKQNLDPYIGVTNLTVSVMDAIALVIESSIEQMKIVSSNQLGPMVISGQLVRMARLPATNVNAGLAIEVQLFVAQDIGQINVSFLVDIPQSV